MAEEDKEWLDWRARFSEVYDEANYSSPLQAAVMRASHRLTEKKFSERDHFSKVLEIGAGTGEHFPFVRHSFDQYVMTDADPKALEVAKKKLSNISNRHSGKSRSLDPLKPGDSGFRRNDKNGELIFETQAGEKLDYADSSFDRVIAVHVLEHIYQPHLVLKEWRRVVKNGGVLSILIPTDPGIAWRLGRHLGPRKNALAQGIAYDYVMAREHVNSCDKLIALIRHYFPIRTEAWWPFAVPSMDLNLFFACHAVVSK